MEMEFESMKSLDHLLRATTKFIDGSLFGVEDQMR